jgi:hypothetical protein
MSAMTHMMQEPGNPHLPSIPSHGFVIAMRAKPIGAHSAARHEWMIVSRWGTRAEYLSIAWTSRPAHLGTAPIGLAPRQTALAVRQERTAAWTPATFTLASSLPGHIPVAGEFVPARGYIRLYGSATKIRMHSEGECLKPGLRAPWHVEATRARWIGEFIEPRATACECEVPPDIGLLTSRTGFSG